MEVHKKQLRKALKLLRCTCR